MESPNPYAPPKSEVTQLETPAIDYDRYKTFWPRWWAGFVDGLVFIPMSILSVWVLDPDRGTVVLVAWTIFSYSAYWLYSVLLHAEYGQTLGKRATGIIVMDASESRIPTFYQACLRDIGYIMLNGFSMLYSVYLILNHQIDFRHHHDPINKILSYAGLVWFLLEITSMLTNKKRRAFHDFIANTVVVFKA